MAHIDADYVYNALGQNLVQSLYTDDGGSFGESELAALEQDLEAASALVTRYASNSGHTITVGSEEVVIKEATLGVFIGYAFGRKQLDVPDAYQLRLDIANQLVSGKLPLPVSDSRGAVGGFSVSDQTDSRTNSRRVRASLSKLEGY